LSTAASYYFYLYSFDCLESLNKAMIGLFKILFAAAACLRFSAFDPECLH